MQLSTKLKVDTELLRLLAEAKEPDEEMLREQRISFAFGNAMNNPYITKESVRRAAGRIRLFESGEHK